MPDFHEKHQTTNESYVTQLLSANAVMHLMSQAIFYAASNEIRLKSHDLKLFDS